MALQNEHACDLALRAQGRPAAVRPGDREWLISLPLEERLDQRYRMIDEPLYDAELRMAREERKQLVYARYERLCTHLKGTPAAERFTREIVRRNVPENILDDLFSNDLAYLKDLIDWKRFGEERDTLTEVIRTSESLNEVKRRVADCVVTQAIVDPVRFAPFPYGELSQRMVQLLDDWSDRPRRTTEESRHAAAFREFTFLGISQYEQILHGAVLPELETLMELSLDELYQMYGGLSTATSQEEALELLKHTAHEHLPGSLGRPPTREEFWSPGWIGPEHTLPGGLMLITAAKRTHVFAETLSVPRFQQALVVNYGPSCGAAESYLASTVAGRLKIPSVNENEHIHRGHVDVYGSVESVRDALFLRAGFAFRTRRDRRFVDGKEVRNEVRPIVQLHPTADTLDMYDLIWVFHPPGTDAPENVVEAWGSRLKPCGHALYIGHEGTRVTYTDITRD